MSDSDLIQSFLKGDINAFNLLVWKYQKPVYNLVYRMTGNEEMTKDICQMTFIRTYKKLSKLKDHDKFASWLFRIAINLCYDEFKKKKNHHFDINKFRSEDGADTINCMHDKKEMMPDEILNQKQIGQILKRCLMAIPEEQRVVIIMKQYHGLKFSEISEILSQPVNTVKSRLYYGLRAMKKILEESKLNKEVMLNEM